MQHLSQLTTTALGFVSSACEKRGARLTRNSGYTGCVPELELHLVEMPQQGMKQREWVVYRSTRGSSKGYMFRGVFFSYTKDLRGVRVGYGMQKASFVVLFADCFRLRRNCTPAFSDSAAAITLDECPVEHVAPAVEDGADTTEHDSRNATTSGNNPVKPARLVQRRFFRKGGMYLTPTYLR